MSYVGRFAPSPTGPLHLGSLAAAVASFLHARQASGRWLVRMEDIDPPREVAGAADTILATLEAYDLHWDDRVLFQSTRHAIYAEKIEGLLAQHLAFRCSCTRSELRSQSRNSELGPRYPGTCRLRKRHEGATSIRARVESGSQSFHDLLQGRMEIDVAALVGDYVVRRKDGLPAYHLAVVVDDQEQGVNHVIRGSDLLLATGVQRHLAQLLEINAPPRYAHIPVLVDAGGYKLSKRHGAGGVDTGNTSAQAAAVLRILGCETPRELQGERPAILWQWAMEHWRLEDLQGRVSLPADDGG